MTVAVTVTVALVVALVVAGVLAAGLAGLAVRSRAQRLARATAAWRADVAVGRERLRTLQELRGRRRGTAGRAGARA